MNNDTISLAQLLLNRTLSTVNSDIIQSFNKSGYGSVRHTPVEDFSPTHVDTLIKLIDNAQFFSADPELPEMLATLQNERKQATENIGICWMQSAHPSPSSQRSE